MIFLKTISSNVNSELETKLGTVSDVDEYIYNLMTTHNNNAFFIAQVHQSEDFLQFSGNSNVVQLDFPVITERQNELKLKFKEIAERMQLTVIESTPTADALFYDINFDGKPEQVSLKVKEFMTEFLNLSENTELKFSYDF